MKHRASNSLLSNFLSGYLPLRFAHAIAKNIFVAKIINHLTEIEIRSIGQAVNQWHISFIDTEGYGRAEVTLGGVSTGELSSQTMETTKVPGLFFIGEVVDVTGWLGGYNFQWAWASGFAAGRV